MKQLTLLLVLLLVTQITFGQKKYTISGYVSDNTGEDLTGANIIVKELTTGTVTNYYGFYSLTLAEGRYTLLISFIGYNSIEIPVSLKENKELKIELIESTEMIESVEVTADHPDVNVKSIEMSVNKLQMKTIEKLPVVFGEPDILKTIQLLPGVLPASEASGGFHVRGGGVDQNLILLDHAPVYNASHMIGFFSVFNSNAIKDISLLKGGIPAEYGGRLSSVLDIHMKEGNKREYKVDGGIGSISSKLTIEGPIVKDKASFLVAARRTYADLFLLMSKDSLTKESTLYFYDLNAKLNWTINSKHRVFASSYFGRDVFGMGSIWGQDYGNFTGTLRWNYKITNKLFLNTTAIYSDYDFNMQINQGFTKFNWITGIKDINFKSDLNFYLNPKNSLKAGVQVTRHNFDPGKADGQFDDSTKFDYAVANNYSYEYGFYISNEQVVTQNLSLQYGLRYSMFQNVGEGESYQFDKSDPEQYDSIGTMYYGKNEIYNTYKGGWEPRLALRYAINSANSVKASYNRMYQYVHLASNSTASLPLDYWFPSSPNIKPQIADQVALGYFVNFQKNMFESSVEVFYKKMQNTVDFKDHASLLLNKFYEAEIRTGSGRAYGAEFMIKKQQGKLTGWISYTYSKSYKTIAEINKGKEYQAAYDKPHAFALVISYDLTDRWNFAGNWVYYSATPRTMPTSRFEYGNSVAPVYADRNTVRFNPYHRLDLAATFRFNKERKRFEHFLNLSVYNTYARHNYIEITFETDEKDYRIKHPSGTYLYTIVPAVSYLFKF